MNMNKVLLSFNTKILEIKKFILNKRFKRICLQLDKISLKKSLNLFYKDKIIKEARTPLTYLTKIKIWNNIQQRDRLIKKFDKKDQLVVKIMRELSSLYLKSSEN